MLATGSWTFKKAYVVSPNTRVKGDLPNLANIKTNETLESGIRKEVPLYLKDWLETAKHIRAPAGPRLTIPSRKLGIGTCQNPLEAEEGQPGKLEWDTPPGCTGAAVSPCTLRKSAPIYVVGNPPTAKHTNVNFFVASVA